MPIPTRVYDRTLNADIERLLYQVQVIEQEAEGLVEGLSDEQFHWSPSGAVWSMAQNFDHMNRINVTFQQNFEESVRRARAENLLHDGPYSYGALGRWMLRMIQPPVKTRVKAPKAFQPGPRTPMAEILEAWRRSQQQLTELLKTANGVDLVRAKVTSPVTNLIKYNLGIGFWIRTAHDRRHLAQARVVRNNPGFPAA